MSLCRRRAVTPFPPATRWPTFVLRRASVQNVCRRAVAIQHQISTSLVPPRASSKKLPPRSLVGGETRSNTTRLWVSISSTTRPLMCHFKRCLSHQPVIFRFVIRVVARGVVKSLNLCWCWLKRPCSDFSVFSLLPLIDKLTKEEEEIYKLQHDLERTVISQQQSKKISEVSAHLFSTKQDN